MCDEEKIEFSDDCIYYDGVFYKDKLALLEDINSDKAFQMIYKIVKVLKKD